MSLIRWGFSLDDIEKIENEFDVRMKAGIYARLSIEQEKEKIENNLLFFDAVYNANIGIQGKKGFNSMKTWLNRMKWRLTTLTGDKRLTIFEKNRGKSFKI